MGTYGFGHVGKSFFTRDDNNIITILHNPIILPTSKVSKRLTVVNKAAIQKRLHKDRNVGSNTGRVVALEDVVGQKSADGNGVVLLRDGFSLGDVAGD